MPGKRIKVSAAFKHFEKQVKRFKKLDDQNQVKYAEGSLATSQMNMLTESLFFNAFRDFENYIRDIFILYTQEKPRTNGGKVKSYLTPKDFYHAEDMMRSSMKFLDWNSPDSIIKRAELYLRDGYPLKTIFSSNLSKLRDYKKIRNHIAHNSIESQNSFKKVVRTYHGFNPLTLPKIGEYLLLTSRSDPTKYHLIEFLDLLMAIAKGVK